MYLGHGDKFIQRGRVMNEFRPWILSMSSSQKLTEYFDVYEAFEGNLHHQSKFYNFVNIVRFK